MKDELGRASLELCCENDSKCPLKYLGKSYSKINVKVIISFINLKSTNFEMLAPTKYGVIISSRLIP